MGINRSESLLKYIWFFFLLEPLTLCRTLEWLYKVTSSKLIACQVFSIAQMTYRIPENKNISLIFRREDFPKPWCYWAIPYSILIR